jgi:hypothetical protein
MPELWDRDFRETVVMAGVFVGQLNTKERNEFHEFLIDLPEWRTLRIAAGKSAHAERQQGEFRQDAVDDFSLAERALAERVKAWYVDLVMKRDAKTE